MIYVASPYTHSDPAVRLARYETVERFIAFCAQRGKLVYSPIVSWHHVAEKYDLPTDAAFWRRQNFNTLRHCSEIWVLRVEGWDISIGVEEETSLARRLGITVRYFDAVHFDEVV